MNSQQAGPSVPGMADLFEHYPFGRAWDEMFAAEGVIRAAYETVHAALKKLDAADLKSRAEILGRSFLDQGITFALGGVERPFPLDLIPGSSPRRSGRSSSKGSRSGSVRWSGSWPTPTAPARCSPTGSSRNGC